MGMRSLLPVVLPFFVWTTSSLRVQSAGLQPAMIGQGPDSVAAKLYYPATAKATGTQAGVQFYCEVTTAGQARHTEIIVGKQLRPFGDVVERALHQGRFSPARAGGKAVPVMLGGTVLFLNSTGQPTILVSLATAEKEKAVSGRNYIQPQMITSYADLERKCITFARSNVLLPTPYPTAEALMNVDEKGDLTGTKLLSESKAGWGAMLLKACEGTKFIPAQANGKPVTGQFNLTIDYRMMTDPDHVLTGSHLRPRER